MKSSKPKAIWIAVLSVSLLAWTAAYAQITPSADTTGRICRTASGKHEMRPTATCTYSFGQPIA